MRYGLLIRLAALLHRLAGLSGPSRAPLTTASISTPKKPLRPPINVRGQTWGTLQNHTRIPSILVSLATTAHELVARRPGNTCP